MTQQRPNPDELLARVEMQEQRRKRGTLKIFFGMAAGVGKTYAMLEEARARAAEGLDVVVGYAEQHIRPETEALLLGMEILPYRLVAYRNTTLKEFDLDAALARKPALMVIDELAHTNAPGMRHDKRWQDVMDVLDAGINVYATLNVQHIESVNDVVERITGVKVRETLPDSVLEQADEVELVDIAPEELLERFREGKVYRPEQAERAARHFFTKGNLIALREMALRTTAQRVDAQMLDFRRENVVRTTWAASERILVCIGPSPLSAKLVRAARRLAAGLRAPLTAVHVQPNGHPLSHDARMRLDQTIRLAEQLGAQTVSLSGESVADEVINYAATHNVTKIVIGKPDRPRWRELMFGSIVDDVIRRSGDIDIYVIRGDGEHDEVRPAPPVTAKTIDWPGIIRAIFIVAITTLIGWPLYHSPRLEVENENILMLYLVGVLWVATHYSRAAAIVASVLSVAAFDLMFVPPYYRFVVHDQQYIVTFAVMLTAALVISALTHRVRAAAEAARDRERRTETLYALSRDLAAGRGLEEIAAATSRQVSEVIGQRAVLLLPDGDRSLIIKSDSSPSATLDEKERSVAQWVYEHNQIAGAGTSTLPASAATFVPLKGSRGAVGVLGVFCDRNANGSASVQRQLVEAFAAQAAVAVERASASEEARQAWERVEAEFLRNTLLSGVSHDLRTPLAAITGAASALIETGERLPPAARNEMLDTIYNESERMERLISNLLDMTRLEAGGLAVKKEWQPLQEAIGSALHRMNRRLQDRDVRINVPADLPLVQIDGLLIEQVMMNLLDNALEHTQAGTAIEITARALADSVEVEVADEGRGIPAGTEQRVFQKFFRAGQSGGHRGVGLGLAICRGIVELHGGKIRAHNRSSGVGGGGGAVVTFTIPHTGAPPTVDATR